MAELPLASNLPEGSVKREDLLKTERFVGQLGLAKSVKITVQSALHGDEWCGVFLAELIPFLARNEPELMANNHFKRRISEMRSAQNARKKGRTLRTEIEEIIRRAQVQRHLYGVGTHERPFSNARRDLRNLQRRAKLLEKEGINLKFKWGLDDLSNRLTRVEAADKARALPALPDFELAFVDAWFDQVVWPELERKEPHLRSNPLIGDLAKANKSGKFQLSDLKTQARATVKRLAALPRAYFFS
jgi:hypothetical protein